MRQPDQYAARVSDIRVRARKGSEQVQVIVYGETCRLDREDIPHLRRILAEAYSRSGS